MKKEKEKLKKEKKIKVGKDFKETMKLVSKFPHTGSPLIKPQPQSVWSITQK